MLLTLTIRKYRIHYSFPCTVKRACARKKDLGLIAPPKIFAQSDLRYHLFLQFKGTTSIRNSLTRWAVISWSFYVTITIMYLFPKTQPNRSYCNSRILIVGVVRYCYIQKLCRYAQVGVGGRLLILITLPCGTFSRLHKKID